MNLKKLYPQAMAITIAIFTLSASAAERLCSIYLESFSELQRQLTLGTEVFEAPQLAAAPLLLNAALPAMIEVDPNKPISLHVLDLGDDEVAAVLEVSPGGELETLLRLVAGLEDNEQLAAPENNIYQLGKGIAAKVAAGRLFLSRGQDHGKALADGLENLPSIPAMPGALRISIVPTALAPKLDGITDLMGNMPNVAIQTNTPETLEASAKFYQNLLKQIAEIHLGVAIQKEGLFIRSRTAPVPESDLALQLTSAQPLEPAQLALMTQGAMLNYASGKATVKPGSEKALLDFLTQLLESSITDKKIDKEKFTELWTNLLQLAGAPYAYTVGVPADKESPLPLRGFIQFAQADNFISQQNKLLQAPEMQTMLKEMNPDGPPLPLQRTHDGITVFNLPNTFDENSVKENLEKNLPAELDDEERERIINRTLESARNSAKLFSYGYDYAAINNSIAFGMGDKEQIERMIAERRTPPTAPSAEAKRIEDLLSPSSNLHTIGSLSLTAIISSFGTEKAVIEALKEQPASDGVLFGSWRFNDEMLGATLITPSEIKVITAAFQAQRDERQQEQPRRRRGRRGGAEAEPAPTRPPIPPGF